MGNYVIEDEIDEYTIPYKKLRNQNNNKKKYLIIGILILIIIALIIVISVKLHNANSFSSYEKKMVTKAKEYVKNNNINTDKEIYIDVSKLGVSLPSSCSLLSGVIYSGNSYQPYLLCNNYESQIIDNNYDSEISEGSDKFELIGKNVMILLKGMEYYELGYVGNGNVTISNNGISDAGVYDVYYVSDNSWNYLIRKVIVIDNPNLVNYFPVINGIGDDPIIVEKGNNYNISPTAVDAVDGDLTDEIITVNNVDVNTPGEYKAIYSVSNSLGYTKTEMQKVNIIDSLNSEINILTSLSNDNVTNESIKARVSITGNNYDYTKLPDGNTVNEKEFEYQIDENGKYEFVVVSTDGQEIGKTLNITNIDKTIPEGSCVATLYYNKTSISVKISSENYITGYNYYTDDISSGFISYNFYNSSKTGPSSVYVMAKDYVGNEGKIVCSLTDKQSNFDPNGIRTVISSKPRLRIPIATALANKGHSVNELNSCIYNRVKEAGPYTRYGVAAAAFALIDCTYNMTGTVLSYNHISGAVEGENYCSFNSDICGKLGINTRWGSRGGSCKKGQTECWHGLNCATFVRWAMCNGGMDLCSRGSRGAYSMSSTTYFPEADGVDITGRRVKYYSGTDLTSLGAATLVRMLKPGDVVVSGSGNEDDHTFVVVGFDDIGIYTAEDGYYMRHVFYSELLNGQKSYRLLFLDKYYANPANRNNLYN